MSWILVVILMINAPPVHYQKRVEALPSIWQIGKPLGAKDDWLEAWIKKVEEVSYYAAPELKQQYFSDRILEERVAIYLTERLRTAEEPLKRINLADALWRWTQSGEVALPALLEVYEKAQDANIRQKVLRTLTHAINTKDEILAVELLMKALKDEETRVSAAAALAYFGSSKSITLSLIDAYKSSNSEETRCACLGALGYQETGGKLVIPILAEAVEKGSDIEKHAAIIGFNGFEKEADQFLPIIIGVLKGDNKYDTKVQAAKLLVRIAKRQPEGILLILPFLHDKNLEVRKEMLAGLGYSGAIQRPVAIRELTIALHDTKSQIRISAVASLWNLGEFTNESVETAIRTLRAGEPCDFMCLIYSLRKGVEIPSEVRELCAQRGWIDTRTRMNGPR